MYCPSIILKITQIWQSCIDFITEDVLSAHAGLSLVWRVIHTGFFPLPFHVEDNDVRSVQRPTNPGWDDSQNFWFSGLRAAMGYKALEGLWVPSHHLPFTVHFDIVRIVISSCGWWGDDVLCLLELNELKSEVSFVCKWVGVHWTHPISCLIFMPHKWGIALPFCAKGLYRKP